MARMRMVTVDVIKGVDWRKALEIINYIGYTVVRMILTFVIMVGLDEIFNVYLYINDFVCVVLIGVVYAAVGLIAKGLTEWKARIKI